jgi:hypothetical protein
VTAASATSLRITGHLAQRPLEFPQKNRAPVAKLAQVTRGTKVTSAFYDLEQAIEITMIAELWRKSLPLQKIGSSGSHTS